jgi:hypothetical protein
MVSASGSRTTTPPARTGATGAHRTAEANGLPVNARSELVRTDVDGPFDGPIELAQRIGESAQAKRCMTAYFYRFAYGRGNTAEDKCRVEAMAQLFKDSGEKFVDLVAATAASPEFAQRTVAP